jgi:hypothetical protein
MNDTETKHHPVAVVAITVIWMAFLVVVGLIYWCSKAVWS